MKCGHQITARTIRLRPSLSRVPSIPLATFPASRTATAAEISEAIRQRFAQSPDAGVLNRLAKVVLDSPNPFYPNARRQPRQDAVILGVLILVALGLVFYFNITSVAG